MLLTCLFIYNALFVKMNEIVTIVYIMFTLIFILACLVAAYELSSFTAAMQNGFQDIGKFADCNLELEQKLKILNFMKRFGKASLLISPEDFFDVTKKFPIKMANSLYSIFSSLLNVRSIQNQNERCREISLINALTRS
ncbi:uncharacterized protein [Centruroides vittatus]|uniref:uncharacterized protein n=1 Tax=Centruroides vittatus TaxID=120091 RepID=UPI003510314B